MEHNIYYQEEIDSIIFTGTKDDAVEEFKRQMFEKYERKDPSPDIETTDELMFAEIATSLFVSMTCGTSRPYLVTSGTFKT